MPLPIRNLAGRRFGSLVASERVVIAQKSHWICRCDCGKSKTIWAGNLLTDQSKSCGYCRDLGRCAIHGRAKTPEWNAWRHMRQRCYLEKFPGYKYYGGRGIRVCDRWLKGEDGMRAFECFFADMGPRPSPKHSLDRRDVNEGYSKDNCRWATAKQQAGNKRKTHTVMFEGRRFTIPELAELKGFRYGLLYTRIITYKWPVNRAINQRSTIRCS